jgi:hypothetical protein
MTEPTFSVYYKDIKPFLQTGEQPSHVFQREKVHDQPKAWAGPSEVACRGKYWTPRFPAFYGEQQWLFCDSGQYVTVPIQAYRTKQRALTDIFGLGQQVALALMLSFQENVPEKILRVIQILGTDCTDLIYENVEAFQCYVGIAFQTEL